MNIIENNSKIKVNAKTYSLEVSADAVSVLLSDEEVALLRPCSAVNTVSGNEVTDDASLGALSFSYNADGDICTFTWSQKSKCWQKKEYVIVAKDSHFEYFVRVYGYGSVDSVNYFIGDIGADICGSEYEFDTGFTPIPTVTGANQCTFQAQTPFDEFSFLTIPPLFSYTFDICGIEPKLSFGLVAEKGEHNFTKFAYNTKSAALRRRFWFYTDQCGHTQVNGQWTSPAIIVYGTPSRHDALKFYTDYYFETGRAERKADTEKKRFWYGPMACGWIEQAAYSIKYDTKCSAADMAHEKLYNSFIEQMHRRDLYPRLLIIDDKWQKNYGAADVDTEKWPDLRGWIDNNLNKNNCHTMLWFKLWDCEGLDEDMTMAGGYEGRRVADPTNPKYIHHIKETMRRLLSSDEGCCNAWGLKIDYAFWQPTGHDAVSYSGKYGVELMLEYIKLLYTAAKEVKKDAVISASPCHPLFAPYLDHARLHDYHPDLRRCCEEFAFRKDIYSMAIPDALIDTDGASFSSRRDTMRYLLGASELGIPDLYCITPMPSLELTDEEWAKVAAAWKEYSDKTDKLFER